MGTWRDWIPEDLDYLDEFVDEQPDNFEPIKKNNSSDKPEPKKIKPRYESEKE